MTITSPAFEEGGTIPKKYTCDGEKVNPQIFVSGVPKGAKSLVLILEDPDALGGTFTHWLIWNIFPTVKEIEENSVSLGTVGKNSAGQENYYPPCPPFGAHRYYFKIFALDNILNINEGAKKEIIEAAMAGHILAQSQLMGKYSR